jgi:hypothetical protein
VLPSEGDSPESLFRWLISGLEYSGGGLDVGSPKKNSPPSCASAAPVFTRLDPSPASSREDICDSGAREISVGERRGPGLVAVTLDPPPRLPDSIYPRCIACAKVSRPDSKRILPCSLPYGGGGARLPVVGAKPHFFTLASMKTKPNCPKLTWTEHGPFAPTVGKKFCSFWPCTTSSSFFPLRVKNNVPDRGRYPTPITSP